MTGSFDICDQINALIGDLTSMQREMTAESEIALDKAAEVIVAEQRRIFAQAHFKREEKRVYKYANDSLIRVTKKKLGRAKLKAYIGFDTETLKAYPELILVEFGRPGKSPKHSGTKTRRTKKRESVEKGDFPAAATVMPIRAGFNLAKESALAAYAEDMFNRAAEIFRGGK